VVNLADLIKDFAPVISTIGQGIIGSDSINDQTDTLNNSMTAATQRLNEGLDQRLGYSEQGIEELLKLLSAGLGEQSNIYRTSGLDYKAATEKGVNQYGSDIAPLVNQLSKGLSLSSDVYGANLDKTAGQTANLVQQGAGDVVQQYAPYVETGQDALGYLAQVMGLDPNQLTDSQRFALDALNRDLMANLNASGLRGAGRAGVGVVSDALAKAKAQMYDQNMQRRDNAASTLNSQGYSATGQTANALEGAKRALADLTYKTGTNKTENQFGVNQKVADTAFNAGQDVASKKYASTSDVNKNTYNIEKGIGDATGKYYENVGNLTGDLYTNRGNTALGKAQVDASLTQNVGANSANADAGKTNIFSSTMDKLGTILTKQASSKAKGVPTDAQTFGMSY